MATPKHRALLGRIAEFAWFVQQGEPAATQALAMLLEDSSLKAAFVHHVETATRTDLSGVEYFVPEAVHRDGGRPDLEGRDNEGRPLLVIEAKFGAVLESTQVLSYLSDQAARVPADRQSAFVLLTPSRRVGEAQRVLEAARQVLSAPSRPIATAVLSWDECINVLENAPGVPSNAAGIAGDLVQFRAMCTTLGGLVIAPLGEAAWGPTWRGREEDLRQIVRDATDPFVPPGASFPVGSEIGFEHRRYIPGGDAAPQICCAVGIGTRFADDDQTPFWLRYHRKTPGFASAQARLIKSRFGSLIETDDRHLWLPLSADPEFAGPELAKQLAVQVKNIISAASAAPPTESTSARIEE